LLALLRLLLLSALRSDRVIPSPPMCLLLLLCNDNVSAIYDSSLCHTTMAIPKRREEEGKERDGGTDREVSTNTRHSRGAGGWLYVQSPETVAVGLLLDELLCDAMVAVTRFQKLHRQIFSFGQLFFSSLDCFDQFFSSLGHGESFKSFPSAQISSW
jgi:hypothetical protein